VKRLVKEFPSKKWRKRGVEDFQKRLQTTGSIARAPGSGRPRTTRTAENVGNVVDGVQVHPCKEAILKGKGAADCKQHRLSAISCTKMAESIEMSFEMGC